MGEEDVHGSGSHSCEFSRSRKEILCEEEKRQWSLAI